MFKPDALAIRTELSKPSYLDVLQSYWGFGAIAVITGYQQPENISWIINY